MVSRPLHSRTTPVLHGAYCSLLQPLILPASLVRKSHRAAISTLKWGTVSVGAMGSGSDCLAQLSGMCHALGFGLMLVLSLLSFINCWLAPTTIYFSMTSKSDRLQKWRQELAQEMGEGSAQTCNMVTRLHGFQKSFELCHI